MELLIDYKKENMCFKPLTGRRKHNIKRKLQRRKKKLEARTWKKGRIVTIKTTDVLNKEHIFVCQMKQLPSDFKSHRCTVCRIINHFRICMYMKSIGCINCMQKSDLSCFPRLIKRRK